MMRVAFDLLLPFFFWGALHTAMVHLRQDHFLLDVQAATTCDAASVEGLPGRHYAVHRARPDLAGHRAVEVGWALLSAEERGLINGPLLLLKSSAARQGAVGDNHPIGDVAIDRTLLLLALLSLIVVTLTWLTAMLGIDREATTASLEAVTALLGASGPL
jgi:hypothetical protein